jgi:hypothetical protein
MIGMLALAAHIPGHPADLPVREEERESNPSPPRPLPEYHPDQPKKKRERGKKRAKRKALKGKK